MLHGMVDLAFTLTEKGMMWDSPLHVVNTFYYHWLIKKLLLSMTGQNIARQAETEKEDRVRQTPFSCQRKKVLESYC